MNNPTENIEESKPAPLSEARVRFLEGEFVEHSDCVLFHGEHDIQDELKHLDGFEEFVRENGADWTE